jgi:hypothetical protein
MLDGNGLERMDTRAMTHNTQYGKRQEQAKSVATVAVAAYSYENTGNIIPPVPSHEF